MKIMNIVGARPNFIKIAALMEAFKATAGIEPILVHTGQHYDERMSDLFFRQLGIPAPDVNLGVGSARGSRPPNGAIGGASHALQTTEIMRSFEPVLLEHEPDVVVVVGDVNSTVACGLVAVKLHVKLAHVEAGLRSFDRSMPEEINRIVTDAISDLLFCTEPSGVENLKREGASAEKVFLVGNVMIDTLLRNRAKADASRILDELALAAGGYAVLTLHRPSNVDDPAALGGILDALEVIQADMPIVFPVHPRTRKSLARAPLGRRVEAMPNLRLIDPAGYLDFLKLMSSAKVVLTDSGGIQEETTILKVPCLTLRANTERPITAEVGSNRVVGTDPARIVAAYREVIGGRGRQPKDPPLWDGRAAERIASILLEKL